MRRCYQLDGGIVTYGKDPEVRGEKFEGKVLRLRRTDRGGGEPDGAANRVVSRCLHCGSRSDRYINCAWSPLQRAALLLRVAAKRKADRYCGRACREERRWFRLPRRPMRAIDGFSVRLRGAMIMMTF